MERKWKTTNCMIQSLVSLAFDETKENYLVFSYFLLERKKFFFI